MQICGEYLFFWLAVVTPSVIYGYILFAKLSGRHKSRTAIAISFDCLTTKDMMGMIW